MKFTPRRFRPAPWASGSHAQTLVARLLRPSEASSPDGVERERITTPDGDFLDVDWGSEPTEGAPLALVVHGLEGSAQRRYVRSMCRNLSEAGVWPVALNLRGCSGEPNRALHYYHSGKTDDPALVLKLMRERYPDRPVGAVGFSLGGNMILKLMGERDDGGRAALDAAVAISVPYDLAAGCALLERSAMGRVYATYFLRSLKAKLLLKSRPPRRGPEPRRRAGRPHDLGVRRPRDRSPARLRERRRVLRRGQQRDLPRGHRRSHAHDARGRRPLPAPRGHPGGGRAAQSARSTSRCSRAGATWGSWKARRGTPRSGRKKRPLAFWPERLAGGCESPSATPQENAGNVP